MGSGDNAFLAIAALAFTVPAVLLGLLLRHFRPRWRAGRVAALSAAPVPAAGLAFCAWMFVDAANAPRSSCGTDACGMAMAVAMMLASIIILAYAVGAFVCWLVLRAVLRR
jgi:hypothetical protein